MANLYGLFNLLAVSLSLDIISDSHGRSRLMEIERGKPKRQNSETKARACLLASSSSGSSQSLQSDDELVKMATGVFNVADVGRVVDSSQQQIQVTTSTAATSTSSAAAAASTSSAVASTSSAARVSPLVWLKQCVPSLVVSSLNYDQNAFGHRMFSEDSPPRHTDHQKLLSRSSKQASKRKKNRRTGSPDLGGRVNSEEYDDNVSSDDDDHIHSASTSATAAVAATTIVDFGGADGDSVRNINRDDTSRRAANELEVGSDDNNDPTNSLPRRGRRQAIFDTKSLGMEGLDLSPSTSCDESDNM
ncbi:hypothetical protein HELRODRAFT_175165 [Helobdella robusta]|uniref:Uncharacterized protein n=1 Tax=Helobdella robusta TaxID=6412 RepID=T1F8Y1_HELRO|nr:hypothetical protein HELRODRAFT_175165 [Helobdella robusta]ESO01136.1 hypothetical protein HELRODRAFT_175165 [Helobdella robusta]